MSKQNTNKKINISCTGLSYEACCIQLRTELNKELTSFFSDRSNEKSLATKFNFIKLTIDKWIKKNDKRNEYKNIVCGKNCPYCCHLRVDVFAPELFIIMDYLTNKVPTDIKNTIKTNIYSTIGNGATPLSRKWWAQNNQPCPFLINKSCSIHPVRPMNCRSVVTGAKSRCIYAFNNPLEEIPMNQMYWMHAKNGYNMGMMALFDSLKLFFQDYFLIELATGMKILFENSNSESEWWNNDSPFIAARIEEQP